MERDDYRIERFGNREFRIPAFDPDYGARVNPMWISNYDPRVNWREQSRAYHRWNYGQAVDNWHDMQWDGDPHDFIPVHRMIADRIDRFNRGYGRNALRNLRRGRFVRGRWVPYGNQPRSPR